MLKKLIFGLLLCSSSAFAASGDTMNFRFSPIGLLVGQVAVDLDYKVADNWTVGPEVAYMHSSVSETDALTSNIDITGYGAGARANWFKNGTYTDGLYVGPSLTYVSVKATASDAFGNISGSASAVVLSALVGYGWFWDSFNMMLGGGAAVPLGNNQVTVTDSNGNQIKSNVSSSLALEYSLGWTF